jgi:hypothetical protein
VLGQMRREGILLDLFNAEGDTFALGINRQNHGIDLHSSLGRQQQEALREKAA